MLIEGKKITKALIIKPHWGNLILDGQKYLELRGSNTNIRGTVALIFSGTNRIWGTVDIEGSKQLSTENFEKFKKYHRVECSRGDISYSKLWGWLLSNPHRLKEPIDFQPKKGCVIWVNI